MLQEVFLTQALFKLNSTCGGDVGKTWLITCTLSLPYFSRHRRMCLRSAALKSSFGWEPLPCCCFLPLSQTGIPRHRNCVPVLLCWETSHPLLSPLCGRAWWKEFSHLGTPISILLSVLLRWQLVFGPGRVCNIRIACYTQITVQITIAITRSLSCREAARDLTRLGVHMPEGMVVRVCRSFRGICISPRSRASRMKTWQMCIILIPSSRSNLFAACQLNSDCPMK